LKKYELVSDYHYDEQLRESLNELVINVLEGDFRDWYREGIGMKIIFHTLLLIIGK